MATCDTSCLDCLKFLGNALENNTEWPHWTRCMDGWVRVLRPFNSISVISRQWKGEHERLCAMKHRLGSGRISPPAGFEPATPWSEVGSLNKMFLNQTTILNVKAKCKHSPASISKIMNYLNGNTCNLYAFENSICTFIINLKFFFTGRYSSNWSISENALLSTV